MLLETKLLISGDSQFGFRKDHCTHDAIFVLSSLIQQCKASQSPYHALFIDITKVHNKYFLKNINKTQVISGL